jgi:hypothetical protein
MLGQGSLLGVFKGCCWYLVSVTSYTYACTSITLSTVQAHEVSSSTVYKTPEHVAAGLKMLLLC